MVLLEVKNKSDEILIPLEVQISDLQSDIYLP